MDYKITHFLALEMTIGNKFQLTLPVKPTQSNLALSTTFSPLIVPGRLNNQVVDVYINNQKIGQWIATKEDTYKLTIPEKFNLSATLDITFIIPKAISPLELGVSNDARALGIAMKNLSLTSTK